MTGTNLKDKSSSRNFRSYKVWQDAVDLATDVYKVTDVMPWFEKKSLCDQLRRAVVSISSNIAEGAGRSTDLEFAHFLDISLGSSNEVETQLLISKNIGYITQGCYDDLIRKLYAVQKQIVGLVKTIRCK